MVEDAEHPRRPARDTRPAGAAAVLALVLTVGAALFAQMSGPAHVPSLFRSGDTGALLTGANVAYNCLRDGTLRSCGMPAPPLRAGEFEADMSGVDRFAPLLYVPAVALRAAGVSRAASVRALGLLNGIAFVFLVLLPWIAGRRVEGLYRLRFVWAVVMLAGPLLPYGVSSWSEVLAAALVAGAVAGVAARWPWWVVAAFGLGAAISKETMAPFVLLLAFAAVDAGAGSSFRSRARALVPLGAAVALGVAANAAFNVFRFGEPRNLTYLAPFFTVRRPGHVAQQWAAVVASPNGGLVVFWPAVVIAGVVAVAALRRGDADARLRIALAVVVGAGFTMSLAMWFSPFGWNAWGPRLSLPIVPAVVLAVFVAGGRATHLPRAVPALLVLGVVLALPNVAVLNAQEPVNVFMNAPFPCPDGGPSDDPFVRCMMDKAWGRPWLPLKVLGGLSEWRTAGLAVALCAAGFGLALAAGRPRGEQALP